MPKTVKQNRRKRKTRRRIKGGGLDERFLQCYEANLAKIETALHDISGTHAIDQALANRFIESQTSPLRRATAKDLIENTVYITLQDTNDIMTRLIDNFYAHPSIETFFATPGDHTIYLFTGKISKSNYFLCVLAYKYLHKDHPVKFVQEFTNELFDTIGTNPVLMIDDVSYSGSQLSNQLSRIYYERVHAEKVAPSIYVLLTALNDVSKSRLSKVPSHAHASRSGAMYYSEYIPTPFQIMYLEDRLYTPLLYKLGIERYILLLLLFSPMTIDGFHPIVSIYLDHKLADPVSTFTQALMYGPIVPNGIYTKIANSDMGMISDFDSTYDPIKTAELIQQLNAQHGTTFSTDGSVRKNCRKIVQLIKDKLMREDIPDRDQPHTGFVPFLNHCHTDQLILQNIQDPEIIEFDYFLFTLPEGCLNNKGCSINLPEYIEETYEDVSKDDKANLIRIHNKINSYRCPYSWYKEGPLKMACE